MEQPRLRLNECTSQALDLSGLPGLMETLFPVIAEAGLGRLAEVLLAGQGDDVFEFSEGDA